MKDVYLYLFPGLVYFWTLFVGQGPMQEILLEKESRTLHRMMAAPISLAHFVGSKFLHCFLLCGLVQLVSFLASGLGLGVPWGNPLQLFVTVWVSALSITGLLALIYALAKTKEQANSMSSLILMALGLLGGGMFPFDNLPKFMRLFGQYSPNRWAALAVQAVAFNKPWEAWLQPLFILTLVGLTGIALAFWRLHRRWNRGGGL